jgi:hypothetical protein
MGMVQYKVGTQHRPDPTDLKILSCIGPNGNWMYQIRKDLRGKGVSICESSLQSKLKRLRELVCLTVDRQGRRMVHSLTEEGRSVAEARWTTGPEILPTGSVVNTISTKPIMVQLQNDTGCVTIPGSATWNLLIGQVTAKPTQGEQMYIRTRHDRENSQAYPASPT